MANAPRDENHVPAILGTNASTAVPVAVDSSGNVGVYVTASSGAAGLSTYTSQALNATAAQVKASAGKLFVIDADNTMNTAKTYLQIFGLPSASVTVGTTVADWVVVLPAGGAVDPSYGDDGLTLTAQNAGTGITIAATTTPGGSTNPGTAIVVNIGYL